MPARAAVLLAVLLAVATCGAQSGGPTGLPGGPRPGPPGDLNVLFIGNSLTYFHSLPSLFEAIAEAEGVAVTVGVIAFPDYALVDHWNQGAARAAIAEGGWDVVVLQQGPSSLPENRALLSEWSQWFEAEIRAAGATPALYSVWPSVSNAASFDAVTESYRQAAVAVNGLLVPGGETWRAAWERDSRLALYEPDGFHPSVLGSYAVALAMVEELAGVRPAQLAAAGTGIPLATRQLLGEAAHEAVLAYGRRHIVAMPSVLRIGHSPDPDDAFMFYGLAEGAVKIRDYAVEHVLEDIQTLNEYALAGAVEVTAISAHAYPHVADRYWVMRCGASIGKGYGPIVVARPDGPRSVAELEGRRVAVPGPLTTAGLVGRIFLPPYEAVHVAFDRIPEAVARGEVDAGLVIHEGQLTYGESGLVRLADMGAVWLEDTGLPLPLGLDVVRKDLGRELAGEISAGLAASIRYAFEHEDEAVTYAMRWGRGLDRERSRSFVRMYVNDLTLDMGEDGRRALETLLERGARAGLVPPVGEIELV